MTPTQAAALPDSELLRAAIAESGKSNSAYARDVLIREPRNIRRWLAGDTPLPATVRTFLEQQVTRCMYCGGDRGSDYDAKEGCAACRTPPADPE